MKVLVVILGLFLINGCRATDPLSGEYDPHPLWWSIDFQGPPYMIGEVEGRVVEDINGRLFHQSGGGAIGTDTPEHLPDAARGWHRVSGNTMPVLGAALPKRIFVRWQSVIELQTYQGWVDIPEQAREVMRTSVGRRCDETPGDPARYGASLILGLAPGGVIQVWSRDSCHRPVKVARGQAQVEPLGPSQGKGEGRYAYKVSEKVQRYIERYGIPYGSW